MYKILWHTVHYPAFLLWKEGMFHMFYRSNLAIDFLFDLLKGASYFALILAQFSRILCVSSIISIRSISEYTCDHVSPWFILLLIFCCNQVIYIDSSNSISNFLGYFCCTYFSYHCTILFLDVRFNICILYVRPNFSLNGFSCTFSSRWAMLNHATC